MKKYIRMQEVLSLKALRNSEEWKSLILFHLIIETLNQNALVRENENWGASTQYGTLSHKYSVTIFKHETLFWKVAEVLRLDMIVKHLKHYKVTSRNDVTRKSKFYFQEKINFSILFLCSPLIYVFH